MYEAITERLDTLLEYTKAKNHEHKTELDVREQEAKVQLAAELRRQHEVLLAQEQKELKKVELEHDLLDKQLHADEESWNRESEQRKLKLQEAQEIHRQEIQNSMSEMQFESSESQTSDSENSTKTISAEQHLSALLGQIKNNELDRSDPKIKEQLQMLLQAIAGL